jgi:hypothetical protein
MRNEDRSWLVTLLMVVVLAAVAWLGGGAVRAGLVVMGRSRDFASDFGILTSGVLFLLLLLAYYLYDYVPRENGSGSRSI